MGFELFGDINTDFAHVFLPEPVFKNPNIFLDLSSSELFLSGYSVGSGKNKKGPITEFWSKVFFDYCNQQAEDFPFLWRKEFDGGLIITIKLPSKTQFPPVSTIGVLYSGYSKSWLGKEKYSKFYYFTLGHKQNENLVVIRNVGKSGNIKIAKLLENNLSNWDPIEDEKVMEIFLLDFNKELLLRKEK